MASSLQDSSIPLRRLTYALYQRRQMGPLLEKLQDHLDSPLVLDALANLLEASGVPFDVAIKALELLAPLNHPIATDALINAIEHPLIKVRRVAIELLCQRDDALPWAKLSRQLGVENAYQIRVVLVTLLARAPTPARWEIVRAIDDPHWRVRKSLVTALQGWAQLEGASRITTQLQEALATRGLDSDRARGVLAYLTLYDHDERSVEDCHPPSLNAQHEPELTTRPWWSEEPSLMKANLQALSKAELREEERWLVWLLTHPDEHLRSSILTKLTGVLSPLGVLSFLIHISEPRRSDRDAMRERTLERISQDTLERCAWLILDALITESSIAARLDWPSLDLDLGALVAWALRWLHAHVPAHELNDSDRWHDAIARAFTSSAHAARCAALEMIASSQSDDPLPDERADKLAALVDDEDAELATAALRALHARAPQRARELMDTCLASDHKHAADPLYLSACADVLGEHPSAQDVASWQHLIAQPFAQVRARCAQHLARAASSSIAPPLEPLLQVLQHDELSQVRLAALTPAQHARLLDDPSLERSWRVLAHVADVAGRGLDALVPAQWTEPVDLMVPTAAPAALLEQPLNASGLDAIDTSADWWRLRPLGNTSLKVSRMGISGHYMLPEEGFAMALDLGINAFFWEPIYLSQTRYFKSISRARKAELVTCCGTFEASPKGMRRDIERALKSMDLEQLQVFYIFWVRERERLSDELLAEMERCQRDGLVHTFGVSTHSRELAREFIQRWPAVMVRHNAAHHGIERDVLPYVDPAKVGLTTFSNLCYGRMLSELPDWRHGIPSAPDAYRYSLSQQGVTSCWSAPSTIEQLKENLSALTIGPMSAQELDALRAYGQSLYRLNTGFNRFIRQR